jgi:hypothetical protein
LPVFRSTFALLTSASASVLRPHLPASQEAFRGFPLKTTPTGRSCYAAFFQVKGDRPEPNKQKHKKKTMKTKFQNQTSRLQNRPEQLSTANPKSCKQRHSNRNFFDPNQAEFGIILQLVPYPFRLRAGDVIRYDNRLCRVIRVMESSAVVIMNRPIRDFKTRFDKRVRFTPPPALFHVSSNSEIPILNR